ncbi:MAG: DNA-directed RNA polymerase subunit omega [Eubacteriales bacterium]|nr:DNA-directed RNA polymerase subunit omega [Bacillota bacterium]
MNQPSLDELLEKVDSRYTLVVVAAKRARALTEKAVPDDSEAVAKPVTTALKEIVRNKISYRRIRQGIK